MRKYLVRYKKFLILLMAAVVILMPQTINFVQADEMPYGVEAILPENQIDKNVSYFDLKVEPNASFELNIKITNSKDKDIKVRVNATDAYTNNNGVIDYSGESEQSLSQSKERSYLTDLLDKEEQIIDIPGKQSKTVSFHGKMDKKTFKGNILGGIYIQEEVSSPSKSKDMIQNEFAYAIAVKLTENLNLPKFQPALNSVKLGVRNYHQAILAEIENQAPVLFSKFTAVSKIYKEGETTPVLEKTSFNLGMAPYSKFEYGIDLDGKAFSSGKYTYDLTIKKDDERFSLKKTFEIDKKDVDTAQKNSVDSNKVNNNLNYIYILLILIFFVILIWIIYYKNKNSKK